MAMNSHWIECFYQTTSFNWFTQIYSTCNVALKGRLCWDPNHPLWQAQRTLYLELAELDCDVWLQRTLGIPQTQPFRSSSHRNFKRTFAPGENIFFPISHEESQRSNRYIIALKGNERAGAQGVSWTMQCLRWKGTHKRWITIILANICSVSYKSMRTNS